MSLLKSPLDILAEAAASEDLDLDNALDIDDIESDLDGSLCDIEDVDDDDLLYTEEMVHIIESKTSLANGAAYLVESDTLAKYMKSANITDVSEALQKLADHNSLDINEMCVVIESGDTLYEVLEEARKVKSPLYKTKIKNVKSSADLLGMLKTKGIKVAKKKSKRNKKKK